MDSGPTIKVNTHAAPSRQSYRGRLAPTPSGLLHMGHASTFGTAWQRCRANRGTLILRIEDIDHDRCKPHFVPAIIEDLQWLGLDWDEGPERPGPWGPYVQSACLDRYRQAMTELAGLGVVYPCPLSRSDLQRISRDHSTSPSGEVLVGQATTPPSIREKTHAFEPDLPTNWRFRVPLSRTVTFLDAIAGKQTHQSGTDFGDFLVWRKDGSPAYELAVVCDDIHQKITEVVRGADLLVSTARQLLLYEALKAVVPAFAHCPLLCGPDGLRLAKSTDALSIRTYRDQGHTPDTYWAEVRNQSTLPDFSP